MKVGICAILEEKYHVEAEIKEPTVIYMERPLRKAEYTIHIEVCLLYTSPEAGSLPAESDLWIKCIKPIQKRRKFSQRCGDFLFLLFPVKRRSVNSQRAGGFAELSLVFVNDSLNILLFKLI